MIKKAAIYLCIMVSAVCVLYAEELKPVMFPKPEIGKGKPVLDILAKRQSLREYSSRPLPVQVLSELLWAADGINRPESGKRTAPSSRNIQEIDIYVVMPEGAYFYDFKDHSLKPVVSGDLRAITGTQGFVKDAPVNLVFVSDYSKISRGSDEDKRWVSGIDTGFISQNVYLYCAAEGLSTVVRAMVDRDALAKALNLRPEQKVVVAQSVGYPKE